MSEYDVPMFDYPERHQEENAKARLLEAEAARTALAKIRNRALEEAADQAEKMEQVDTGGLEVCHLRYRTWQEIAAAIRALKTKDGE